MESSTKWALGIGAAAAGLIAYSSYAASAAAKKLPAGVKIGQVAELSPMSYEPTNKLWTVQVGIKYADGSQKTMLAIVASGAEAPPAAVVQAVVGSTIGTPLSIAPAVKPAGKQIGKVVSTSNVQKDDKGNHYFTATIAFEGGSTQTIVVPVFDPQTIAGVTPDSAWIALMLGNMTQALTLP